MSLSVGRVAALAGVTVRTLHHYDEIGLLSPGGRNHAGHRLYDDVDLARLQQILFYRELGFPLDEVAALLDDPDADPQEHLRRQHGLLAARIERLRAMATAVERAMEADRMGINLTPEERFELFGDDDPAQYEEETRERWGDTEAFAQSRARTATYTKEDWQRITAEQADLGARFVALMDSGVPPEDAAAMDLAEEHRAQMNRNFFDVGHAMHRNIAELYVCDERFTRNIDKAGPGLAAFMRAAIAANARRHGA